MAIVLPPCPDSLKQIKHYLKAASEHESRDRVVAYWCRLYALQTALKIDKKTEPGKTLLIKLMDWLENEKKSQLDNEAITNDIAAQAHIENYCLRLFMWADGQDRAGIFNKNVVKAFYTSAVIMDVLNIFGERSDDIISNCKYAKWKASYIHNCLKNGETPVPGPIGMNEDYEEDNEEGAVGYSGITGTNTNVINETDIPNQPPSSTEDLLNIPTSSVETDEQTNRNQSSPNISPLIADQTAKVILESKKNVSPILITKAQKYCRFAASALNYEEVGDAIIYLHKALDILENGKEG